MKELSFAPLGLRGLKPQTISALNAALKPRCSMALPASVVLSPSELRG
jgi:hypothetical protein